ncbi:hypothetical protein AaE_008462 [Aphanomyces astaci]|uniref:Uncharacterized protein n=1 Tax=Aphanomyces astaci TaxID=112090 RepID=A0A6A5AB79_APHAT|nr:hypothetical protein AaE_008462 [Aphanomyces astaci]
MDPRRNERDRLVHALAEFASFFANESKRRRQKSRHDKSPRNDVLAWLGQLTPMERAAVTTTVDVSFVRLVIQMMAAPKSKSRSVDEFHVLRTTSKQGKVSLPFTSRSTFSRRPVTTTRDGDEIISMSVYLHNFCHPHVRTV